MPLHDIHCPCCEREFIDEMVRGEAQCPECGGTANIIYNKMPFIYGTETRYNPALDMYVSRAEERRIYKDRGLAEAGDKAGGARTPSPSDHGKVYSYQGQGSRKSRTQRTDGLGNPNKGGT